MYNKEINMFEILKQLKEKKQIKFNHNNSSIIIDFNDDKLNIFIDGDINIGINGELGIATKDHNICLDSINSNIFLNSRQSKALKNLPESIEYLENLKKQQTTIDLSKSDNKTSVKKGFDILNFKIDEVDHNLNYLREKLQTVEYLLARIESIEAKLSEK